MTHFAAFVHSVFYKPAERNVNARLFSQIRCCSGGSHF